MNAINYLSNGTYLILPLKSNPRVYLAIENKDLAKKSFDLYQPYSLKARILKLIAKIICVNLNFLAKKCLPTYKSNSSSFVSYLEKKLNKKIITSSYISTAKDKIVLQVIVSKSIYGYLKIAISSDGIKRISNEKRAIETLSNIDLCKPLILAGYFKKSPFFLIENIQGRPSSPYNPVYKKTLKKLEKKDKYLLKNHPRIIDLRAQLIDLGLIKLHQQLSIFCQVSKKQYKEVYEHGDFAPWNLIKLASGDLIPFDLEYFEEQGLEHLDEFKYIFQIEFLLNKKKGFDLINVIKQKIQIDEFDIIFKIFIFKEIAFKKAINEEISIELSILKLIQ